MTDLPPMPAIVESISEAKAHFSAIIDAVGDGKMYVICRAGKPVAMLSPFPGSKGAPRIGLLKGKLQFDAGWWKEDRRMDGEIAASLAEG